MENKKSTPLNTSVPHKDRSFSAPIMNHLAKFISWPKASIGQPQHLNSTLYMSKLDLIFSETENAE